MPYTEVRSSSYNITYKITMQIGADTGIKGVWNYIMKPIIGIKEILLSMQGDAGGGLYIVDIGIGDYPNIDILIPDIFLLGGTAQAMKYNFPVEFAGNQTIYMRAQQSSGSYNTILAAMIVVGE